MEEEVMKMVGIGEEKANDKESTKSRKKKYFIFHSFFIFIHE